MTHDVEINGRTRRVEVQRAGTHLEVTVDGRRHQADVTVINGLWSLILEPGGGSGLRRSFEVAVTEQPPGSGVLAVHVDGRLVRATVAARRRWSRGAHDGPAASAGQRSPQAVTAPMPGKIVKLLVRPGEAVEARQPIVVVEAMKMENELRAPRGGTVTELRVAEGASVEAGAVLAVIE